jgi:hypothetical protein
VDAHPLARQRVGVDRVARERVTEDVAVTGVIDQQKVLLDGLAQRLVERTLVQAGDRGQQPIWNRPPACRRRLQDAQRRCGQAVGTREEHVAQRRGQPVDVRPTAHGAEELLD